MGWSGYHNDDGNAPDSYTDLLSDLWEQIYKRCYIEESKYSDDNISCAVGIMLYLTGWPTHSGTTFNEESMPIKMKTLMVKYLKWLIEQSHDDFDCPQLRRDALLKELEYFEDMQPYE